MRLECDGLSPNPISWHEAEAEQIWIVDSFTWGHRFLSFRETDRHKNKPLQRPGAGRPAWQSLEKKWLGAPASKSSAISGCHSSPVGKTQGTLDSDLDPET